MSKNLEGLFLKINTKHHLLLSVYLLYVGLQDNIQMAETGGWAEIWREEENISIILIILPIKPVRAQPAGRQIILLFTNWAS